jgi:hypothetical protein
MISVVRILVKIYEMFIIMYYQANTWNIFEKVVLLQSVNTVVGESEDGGAYSVDGDQ